MGFLTENKPKCLISVNGNTILKSLSNAFPNACLQIISDYKIDVLRNYLDSTDPNFRFNIIQSQGKGTCAGISEALNLIPNGEQFAISWSDLFYKSPISLTDNNKNYVCVSNTEKCRYSFKEGKFIEESTTANGVIGLFIFKSKEFLTSLPKDGEFVKFLASSNIEFDPFIVDSVVEIGTLDKYLKFKASYPVSRFFNNVEMDDTTVTKYSINKGFDVVHSDEKNWYQFMQSHGYGDIPRIISYEPLKMERVIGSHPYQIDKLSKDDKIELIKLIIEKLQNIHSIASSISNYDDIYKTYVVKTLDRIRPVTNILKLKSVKQFVVNGKRVSSLLPEQADVLKDLIKKLKSLKSFFPIHGDPTFSNIIVSKNNSVKFIDPRGYFGDTKIFGDGRYDFAKLYYSAVGNYDQFNNGNFRISINFPEVNIKIQSSQFELTDDIFSIILKDNYRDIKILHSLIWISLSGYVLNDYDSILAAYFMGLYYLEGVLSE